MFVDLLRNRQVEPWIIHQDNHIRLPLRNIPETEPGSAQYRTQMSQDRPESHIGQFPVVLDQFTACRLHHVTAKTTELRPAVPARNRSHQV